MPSKTGWRDLEQNIGRDAFRLDGTTRGGSAGMILCVWLAFYVLAVTHALLPPRVIGPITTAEVQELSLAGTSR
jgi:hypothetical protein